VNNGGNADARVIAPGSLTNSMLLSRISRRGPGQMPPLTSSVLDTPAIQLVSAWITNDLAIGWSNTTAPTRVSLLAISNGAAAIQFTQPANRAQRVESATDLTPPIAWRFVNAPENRPVYPSIATNVAVSDPEGRTNATQKFYRLRLSAP
jgi:hypothetical protein